MKLELARRSKEIDELNQLKSFKCTNTKMLPKDYKNPIKGYEDRVKKFNAVKNPIQKPPTGRPNIDNRSRAMATARQREDVSTWERMYAYKDRRSQNRTSADERKHKGDMSNFEQYTKPSRNKSLNKHNSEGSIKA